MTARVRAWRLPVLAASLLAASVAWAKIDLKNVRMWHGPENSRLVFDLSAPVQYKVFHLNDPLRMVVDLDDAVFRGGLPSRRAVGRYLHRIRTGRPRPGVLRIVLDLKQRVDASVFVLTPNELYGHRLVIDIGPRAADRQAAAPRAPAASTGTARSPPRGPLLIAIDAGHGGEDPGASGRRGTREKRIVLSIARKLKKRLDRHPRMTARLTRRGDYYVSLRKRTQLARRFGADLFVSLHADGFKDSRAHGMSVYALSERGATSETARWLADKENASDLIGGISLQGRDDVLAQVLIDLSMTKTVNDGAAFANFVLEEMKRLGPVHSERVEQAGFVVLKSPDIPSILIETGYITNPREEKLLRSERYQQKMADAIYDGIVNYANALKLLEERDRDPVVHLVARGESLSAVALRYGVTVKAIRRANNLVGDRITVGQKLTIPRRDG